MYSEGCWGFVKGCGSSVEFTLLEYQHRLWGYYTEGHSWAAQKMTLSTGLYTRDAAFRHSEECEKFQNKQASGVLITVCALGPEEEPVFHAFAQVGMEDPFSRSQNWCWPLLHRHTLAAMGSTITPRLERGVHSVAPHAFAYAL